MVHHRRRSLEQRRRERGGGRGRCASAALLAAAAAGRTATATGDHGASLLARARVLSARGNTKSIRKTSASRNAGAAVLARNVYYELSDYRGSLFKKMHMQERLERHGETPPYLCFHRQSDVGQEQPCRLDRTNQVVPLLGLNHRAP